MIDKYSKMKKPRTRDRDGPLFIFSDGMPVRPEHYRFALKLMIKLAGLNPNNYDTHSLRIGRSFSRTICQYKT